MFEQKEYRHIIKAFIATLPFRGHGELTRIAKHLQVNTTMISQIMSGAKNLSVEQAVSLAEYMGLNTLESQFFVTLVQKERAGTKKAETYFETELERIRKEALKIANRIVKNQGLLEAQRAQFYSSWIYSAIRLFSSCGEGKTLEEIQAAFHLDRKTTLEALQFLVENKLCNFDGKIYSMGTQATHLEAGSPYLVKHHTNWRLKALERMEIASEDHFFYSAPCSLSEEDFFKIRELLMASVQKSRQVMIDSPAERIACLTIDWFWLLQK